jgi:hypothetical protein
MDEMLLKNMTEFCSLCSYLPDVIDGDIGDINPTDSGHLEPLPQGW